MIRTQIQLPDRLYNSLKRLAELQETSLADIIRRATEKEILAHPEIDTISAKWSLPTPRALGIRKEVPVQDWRLLANEDNLV
ncbi:MAG: antitoxin [Deltaproteobacteria bacterium]|nr:antitoxin [Deltaproteobacteria bacterium]